MGTSVGRQWLSGRHVIAAALTRNNGTRHATSPNTSPVASRWRNEHLSATAVMPRNNRRTVGSSVYCWVRPEATSRGPTGQANQSWDAWDGGDRRAGGWCEIATSLRGSEPGNRGTSTVGRRYTVAQWKSWLGMTSLRVIVIYKM
jgi:hypothetical protein